MSSHSVSLICSGGNLRAQVKDISMLKATHDVVPDTVELAEGLPP